MEEELRAVPGVTDVAEEDREVWIGAGERSGAELTRAAAVVVDELSARIREELDLRRG
jgi:hypothetical protein